MSKISKRSKKKVWQVNSNKAGPVFIVKNKTKYGHDRYSYEHFHSQDSVFRGHLVFQKTLTKGQFKIVLAILEDLGIPLDYLGER
jgi:hypothetical protein